MSAMKCVCSETSMRNCPEHGNVENCDPCEMQGVARPSVGRTGMDYTPCCRWHYNHSWSSKPPTKPWIDRVTKVMWSVENPDGTSIGPFDSKDEALSYIGGVAS